MLLMRENMVQNWHNRACNGSYCCDPLHTTYRNHWKIGWTSEGIQERVPQEEPISWCSPLVMQPKPRFKNEKNFTAQIRASIDLQIPNKHMERDRIVQNPIVEDFTDKFHDCTIFSKMDTRQGYHQLLLHPDSRSIATFGTPWGNLRPRRLVFGAKS